MCFLGFFCTLSVSKGCPTYTEAVAPKDPPIKSIGTSYFEQVVSSTTKLFWFSKSCVYLLILIESRDAGVTTFNQWKSGWEATDQSQVKKLTKTFIPYTFQYLTMCHSLYLYSLALQQHWKKCTFIFVGDEILFLENCHFRAEHNILLSLSYVTKDLCLRTYVFRILSWKKF